MPSIREQYRRERRRVLNLVRAYEKRGYDVELITPKIVKKPTIASINRLKKITPEAVRMHSFTAALDTGEKINYNQYKIRFSKAKSPSIELKRQVKNGRMPFEWQISLENILNIFSQYPENTRYLIEGKVESAIANYGERNVGITLQGMMERGEILQPAEAYNYRAVLEMSNNLMRYLGFSNKEINYILNDLLTNAESQEYYEGEFDEWN